MYTLALVHSILCVLMYVQRKPPEKLLQFPSGAIKGLGVSSKEHLAAVIAEDGEPTVCNHSIRMPLVYWHFHDLWTPCTIHTYFLNVCCFNVQ